MAIIAVDFDGTIVEHEFPLIGELRQDAKEILQLLHKEGHKIIIWTCRTTQNLIALDEKRFSAEYIANAKPTIWDVRDFLIANEIPFDTINHNIPELSFQPSPKVYADFYIDDKNIGGLPPWREIYDLITVQLKMRELGLE